jgi:hypothetical protein
MKPVASRSIRRESSARPPLPGGILAIWRDLDGAVAGLMREDAAGALDQAVRAAMRESARGSADVGEAGAGALTYRLLGIWKGGNS